MIKDRGNIKWSSLMLTEHREKLRQMIARNEEQEMPEIDEQKLIEMNRYLKESLTKNISLIITYYHDKKFYSLKGKVKEHKPVEKEIIFTTIKGEYKKISLSKIIEVKLL